MPLAVIMARLRRECAGLFLHPVQVPDQGQPTLGFARRLVLALCLDCLIKLAPRVRHAPYVRQVIHGHDCIVTVITVGL